MFTLLTIIFYIYLFKNGKNKEYTLRNFAMGVIMSTFAIIEIVGFIQFKGVI